VDLTRGLRAALQEHCHAIDQRCGSIDSAILPSIAESENGCAQAAILERSDELGSPGGPRGWPWPNVAAKTDLARPTHRIALECNAARATAFHAGVFGTIGVLIYAESSRCGALAIFGNLMRSIGNLLIESRQGQIAPVELRC